LDELGEFEELVEEEEEEEKVESLLFLAVKCPTIV